MSIIFGMYLQICFNKLEVIISSQGYNYVQYHIQADKEFFTRI